MSIKYIVPYLNSRGGIQSYAHSVKEFIEQNTDYKIEMLNYKYDVPMYISAVAKYSPSLLRGFIFKHYIQAHFLKQFKPKQNSIIECWQIDPSLYLNDEVNLITHVHGMEILPEALRLGWQRNTLLRQSLFNSKKIIATSKYTANYLQSRFNVDKKKIVVIYPPVNTKEFFISNSKSEKYTIGTLCRLVHRKNVHSVIKALDLLFELNPNFKYILVGDGPERKKLLALLNNSKFEWEYINDISEEQKRQFFYPSLNLFIMPTLQKKNDIEGFGIVYIEANASGVPVIAANSGGAQEAVSANVSGIFVDPNNPRMIARSIEKIMNKNPFSQNDILKWARRFDISSIGPQYVKLYDELH